MATSISSTHPSLSESILSPSAATSSYAASSTLYSLSGTPSSTNTTSYTLSLSGTDHLRDVFTKRIRSLVYLKRTLQGQSAWFQVVQLKPNELASVYDNDRMHKRTLRYSLLGLSLSGILEIANPSDLARAVVSLVNELEGCTDDNLAALTSGPSAANFGAQRPKMRSFFKSGKQSLKRSTAAQAISEFGMLDSNMGPASTSTGSNEQASYLMAPNIPFQLDFFQTFFTLCDMLTEVYHKMLSFLPRDAAGHGADATTQSYGTFPRASSPPISVPASGHASQDQESRTGSISQAFSTATANDTYTDSSVDKTGFASAAAPVISGMTQELLLKADAKIKKVINAQVKDIDNFARQAIKDELASLDPLMKDLGLGTPAGSANSASLSLASTSRTTSAFTSTIPTSSSGGGHGGGSSGLPTSSTSSLPFGFPGQPSSSAPIPSSSATTHSSRLTNIVPASSLPSHFRRAKPDVVRTSQDSAHHGHHQFNLASLSGGTGVSGSEDAAETPGGIGSLIRSRSGRLRSIVSSDKDARGEDASVPVYPGSAGTSPIKES